MNYGYDLYSGAAGGGGGMGIGGQYPAADDSANDFNENVLNDNPTRWVDYNSFLDDTGPISALSFHDSSELLWIGNQTGRLTSYLHSSSYDQDSNFVKYSSFSAHNNSIVQLLPISKHILSISSDTVRMHSLGGLPVTQFKPDLTNYNGELGELSCGTLFEPSGGLFRAESQKYLFLGSSHSFDYVYDLNVQDAPLAIFDVEVPSLCVSSSVTFLTVGGVDGKIRFLDPSLRTTSVQHVLDAHNGGLSSFSVQSDGMTLISCGYQSRVINPYDVQSPVLYHPDPVVKIFDLRMLRQMTHLALAIPPPCYVRFLPKNNELDSEIGVLAVSSNGYIQTVSLDAAYEPMMNTLHIQYATLSNPPQDGTTIVTPEDEVTVVDVSSNGRLIGVGSLVGVVSLHAAMSSLDESPTIQVNKFSDHLTIPESRPSPPRFVSTDSPEIATAFTISNHLLTLEERHSLSSSFLSTPRLRKSHLKLYPRMKILPELLNGTIFQGSVGSTKNITGFPPNSFLCSQTRGHGYAISDPRHVSKQPSTVIAAHNTASQRTESVGSASSIESSELFFNSIEYPPAAYTHKRSPRGKNRMQKFNYTAYNSTPFVGLENLSPNSWTNPFLQFLFALPEIRKLSLETQQSPFHQSMPSSLTGELGFLFDMMLAVHESSEKHPQLVSKVATPSNFQRTLRVTPEAVISGLFPSSTGDEKALGSPILSPSSMISLPPPPMGLVDDVMGSRGTSDGSTASHPSPPTGGLAVEPFSQLMESKLLQNKVQLFTKFLIHQLKKEFDSDSKYHLANHLPFRSHDSVSSTFAFESITTTTFLNSQTKGLTTHHTSYCVDLSYPPPTVSANPPCVISFSEVLYSSICKTTHMRGWCAASESYEPCRQMKRIQFNKLQNILTILCGDVISSLHPSPSPGGKAPRKSMEDSKQRVDRLWRSQNPLGGPWLPAVIEVLFVPSNGSLGTDADMGEVFISELLTNSPSLLPEALKSDSPPSSTWLIYDGKTSMTTSQPASKIKLANCPEEVVARSHTTLLTLFGVISGIRHCASQRGNEQQLGSNSKPSCHTVLHLVTKKPSFSSSSDPSSLPTAPAEWTLFNDFSISPSKEVDARIFSDWRFPCVIFFMKSESSAVLWKNGSLYESYSSVPRVRLPATSIMNLNSISSVPCVPMQHPTSYHPASLPPLAFDAEFVSVEVEKVEIDARGQRIVHDEGRQVVARISIIECSPSLDSQFRLLVDDYILPIEPVVDYVTRFSGLHEEDLNPSLSRHAVVPHRTAYLKLKHFVDCGCVFVGHGLQKDFDIANIFVPPEQILDTVELWRIPNQRKVSLRFLASYILGMEIQDDLHDSIEDARTAYLLFKRYEEEKKKGDQVFQASLETLRELYAFGAQTNWTIGLDRISTSPVHRAAKKLISSSSDHRNIHSQHRHHHPPPFPHNTATTGYMNFSHHPNIAGYPLYGGGNQSQLPNPPYLYTQRDSHQPLNGMDSHGIGSPGARYLHPPH